MTLVLDRGALRGDFMGQSLKYDSLLTGSETDVLSFQ